jgi:tubulin polyglutamylase TTLL9
MPLVLFRVGLRNTIYDTLHAREGWQETTADDEWDFFWADVGWIHENLDRVSLEEHQRVNHFRNHYELTRKDLLVKNMKRMKRNFEREGRFAEAEACDFVPLSFVLPADYSLFVEAFKRTGPATWIMKPAGRSQGKGIFLINRLSEVADWRPHVEGTSDKETYVAQRYISDPYLIGGKKFDLRLYVLVTSFSPLRVWIYRDGFARFSFNRYSSSKATHDDLATHLTNVAIQKLSPAYDRNVGCKWRLRHLKLFLASKHGMPTTDRLFARIQDVVIRSLVAVQPIMIADRHCFELYGYDVLLDRSLNVYVLEVNASPSLTADTDEDYALKRILLDDMLSVVDMEGRRSGDETTVGGFDLVYDGGPLELSHFPSSVSTPFGVENPREAEFAGLKKPDPRPAPAPLPPDPLDHEFSPPPPPAGAAAGGGGGGGGGGGAGGGLPRGGSLRAIKASLQEPASLKRLGSGSSARAAGAAIAGAARTSRK